MKLTVFLLAASACGRVLDPSPPSSVAPDAAPPLADTTGPCVPTTMRFSPPWVSQGAFQHFPDPVGSGPPVWRPTSIPSSASFSVPYRTGDFLVELGFDAYGNGSHGSGLINLKAMYQPDGAGELVLAVGQDTDRQMQWGKVYLVGSLAPIELVAGKIWVQFDVTELDYYIGAVTATFQRTCSP